MGPEGADPQFGPDLRDVEPQPPTEVAHTPERQENWLQRILHRRANPLPRLNVEQQMRDREAGRADRRDVAEVTHEQARANNPENMLEINTPQEAVTLMEDITAAQWRQRQLNEQYGRGAGVEADQQNLINMRNWMNPGWRAAFMAGEFDFRVDQDGQIQRDIWNNMANVSRRAIRTLTNRQVLVTGALTAVLAFTPIGAGVIGTAALAGGIAGRGLGEAAEALWGRRISGGGDRLTLREIAAHDQFFEHGRLHTMAEACTAPEITPEERNHRIQNLVNAYHDVNAEVVHRQKEALEEDQRWNKTRDIMAKIGAGVGMIGGIAANAAEMGQHLMTMHLSGVASQEAANQASQQAAQEALKNGANPEMAARVGAETLKRLTQTPHLVELINGHWQFAYNSVAEATKTGITNIASLAHDPSGNLIHALGEPTYRVIGGILKNALPYIVQTGVAVGGLFAGRAAEQACERNQLTEFDRNTTERQHESDLRTAYVSEQIPGHGESFANQQTPEQRWTEMFLSPDRIPRGGQVWMISQPGAAPILYRLNTVNQENGLATGTQVDLNFNPVEDQAHHPIMNNQIRLEQLARFGSREDEVNKTWLRQFGNNDHIILTEAPVQIFDDHNRPIPNEDYQVIKNEHDISHVTLRRPNANDVIVPVFQLAYHGINRYQPEQQQRQEQRAVRIPIIGHVWRINRDRAEEIPELLRDHLLTDVINHFVIQRVGEHECQVRTCDENGVLVGPARAINISMQQWSQIQEVIHDTQVVVEPARRNNNPDDNDGNNNDGGNGGQGGGRGGGGRRGNRRNN